MHVRERHVKSKHTYAEDKRNVTSITALDFVSGSHAVLITVDTVIVLQRQLNIVIVDLLLVVLKK